MDSVLYVTHIHVCTSTYATCIFVCTTTTQLHDSGVHICTYACIFAALVTVACKDPANVAVRLAQRVWHRSEARQHSVSWLCTHAHAASTHESRNDAARPLTEYDSDEPMCHASLLLRMLSFHVRS
jgi:hypothetical protein